MPTRCRRVQPAIPRAVAAQRTAAVSIVSVSSWMLLFDIVTFIIFFVALGHETTSAKEHHRRFALPSPVLLPRRVSIEFRAGGLLFRMFRGQGERASRYLVATISCFRLTI